MMFPSPTNFEPLFACVSFFRRSLEQLKTMFAFSLPLAPRAIDPLDEVQFPRLFFFLLFFEMLSIFSLGLTEFCGSSFRLILSDLLFPPYTKSLIFSTACTIFPVFYVSILRGSPLPRIFPLTLSFRWS